MDEHVVVTFASFLQQVPDQLEARPIFLWLILYPTRRTAKLAAMPDLNRRRTTTTLCICISKMRQTRLLNTKVPTIQVAKMVDMEVTARKIRLLFA